jgi:hypothetical protein
LLLLSWWLVHTHLRHKHEAHRQLAWLASHAQPCMSSPSPKTRGVVALGAGTAQPCMVSAAEHLTLESTAHSKMM